MNKSKTGVPGTIKEVSPGVWRIKVSHGYRADGKRRRIQRTVHGDEQDAKAACVKLAAELGASPNVGDSMTLGEYYESFYLPSRRVLLAKSTIDRYDDCWRNHIGPALGHLEAETITKAVVQRWVLTLPTRPTMTKCLAVLRAIINAMYDDELLDTAPDLKRIKMPAHQKRAKDIWTVDEIHEAMERLRGHRIEPLWLVMVGTGTRRSEALAVKVPEDLQWDSVTRLDGSEGWSCRVRVEKALTTKDGLKDVKTHQERMVTLGEPFASRLHELVVEGLSGPLMARKDGRPLKASSVPETWRRLFHRGMPLEGMRYVELNSMRHAHETIVARAGISDSINSRVHGHSERIEYKHYLALGQDDADTVSQIVEQSLAR